MLSVQRRQEGGGACGVGPRGGVAGGGMADDVELEEGEACADEDAFIDPDVAFPHIDEKVQDFLGHFQKDFEGGVSAENLGSKFGGYGSFLRSPPPLPQTRSPPKVANLSTSRSPYHQSSEGMGQNPSVTTVASVSWNNGSAVPLPGDLSKKERFSSTYGEKDSAGCSDSLDNSISGSDQKTLKVRIKVSSENVPVRNNAAIYSGLGLDISSSSSMEDTPDGCEGHSPEFSNIPHESPRTILQIMTCFSVPGGFLLSPLHGNVLQLTKKVAPLLKKWKTNLDIENVPGACEDQSESSLPRGDVRGHEVMRMKSDANKKKSVDVKSTRNRSDTNAIMKREIDIERSTGQEIISDTPSTLVPNSKVIRVKGESQFEEESRTTCVSRPLQETKDAQLKEWTSDDDMTTVKAEADRAMECIVNSGSDNSGSDYSASKGKLKLKTGKTDNALEERKQVGKVNLERKSDVGKGDFEGNESKRECAFGPCENMKKVPGKETFTYGTSGENNSQTEAKRMQKEQKVNIATSFDLLEDDMGIHSSGAVKERKNDLQSKSSHVEKKAKAKPHKDLNENLPNRSYWDKVDDVLKNGNGWGELRQKEKLMTWKNDSDKESDIAGAARKEITVSVKHDKQPASEGQHTHVRPTSSVATANATAPLAAPLMINEHWVCCDICQKWRLLPYEMDPSTLPKKWKCSMLHWLTGMNRCDISEDATTNALNALYVVPVPATGISSGGPPHTAAAGLATSSTFNVNGQFEHSRKRKNAQKDGTCLVEDSHPTLAPVPPLSNQQAPANNKRSADGEQCLSERDCLSKSVVGPLSKSDDFVIEKKSKHKIRGSHSEGGDPMERSKKHSKMKSKRGIDQDECKTSKKTKKEDSHHFGKDWNPECDLASGEVPDEAKVLPAKATTVKNLHEWNDVSSSKEKIVPKCDLLEKSKKSKDADLSFHKENSEHIHHADVELFDLSSKKRMVKEWEQSQQSSVAQMSKVPNVNYSCVGKGTYKKSKIMKPEEMVSGMDSRRGKAQDAVPILSSNRGHLNKELAAGGKLFTGKEDPSELRENVPPVQVLELSEPTKRDVAFIQTSTAATSSSSKVSGSQRNKTNSQETKGSPVESVSSSPLRNVEKLSHTQSSGNDGSLNADVSIVGSPVKYPNTEVGMVDNNRQPRNIQESLVASEPILHGSSRGYSNNKETVQLTRTHASDGIHLERGLGNVQQKVSGRKDLAVKGSSVGKGYSHMQSGDKKSSDTGGSSMQTDRHSLFDSKSAALDIKYDSVMHEDKKNTPHQDRNGSVHCLSDGNQQSEAPSGKEKSQLRSDKQAMQKPIIQMVHSPLKESKLEVHSTSVKSDVSKMKSQLRRHSGEKGVQHGIANQVISNPADTSSPIRKDGSSTALALKEARDLKHKANHLKEKGLELESTGLYFEAALKFLHVASLLETPSLDSSKPADAAQSMKMYSDTAKLCEFCAHAYERCKKMAAAALAYKCVEVAYLKAAFYRHPGANKDRQELQAVVQIPPGESPSSSASDIDNLNSHGLSKAPSTKDVNSPQIAGNNLLIAARCQPHLLRLLAYTNDVNCAFDATRKSQIAIASAAGNHEKGVDDGLASVRTVLDLNFHNVNELLRLVRLSMESISS